MYDKIIDDYLNDVTRDMDPKLKSDVKRELKTHILDSAEALASERYVPADENIVREVISKMGSPKEIASRYPSRKGSKKAKEFMDVLKVLAGLIVAFTIAGIVMTMIAPELGLPVHLILTGVVPAMIIAVIVISIIFAIIYIYESRLKMTYEEKIKKMNENLEKPSSPIRVAIITICNLVFLAVINLYWDKVPAIIVFEGDKPTGIVSLFSPDFATFIPYINMLIIATIIVNLLYLLIKSKWIPSALETVLGIASAILIYGLITMFPFNPELISEIVLGIKLLLAFVLIMTLFGAVKNLWQAIILAIGK
ncbi:hypothetical protein CUJ83_02805 [Methanocella sp. CWC-04]|uniref:Uncharacterized protein n=1 Tax=Methanooceanicella nereidis TaxID=2052831 RepID=A0AAP2RCV1_9EURY|nr:hypothetical protein [Methanocella sp. CWC-04]MCD1293927.1 hypothetical protein [Methanocella sp. CWC-04]